MAFLCAREVVVFLVSPEIAKVCKRLTAHLMLDGATMGFLFEGLRPISFRMCLVTRVLVGKGKRVLGGI